MRLAYSNDKFVFHCTFDEKATAKEARCRWDPKERIWYTDSVRVAEKLAEYADELASARVRETLKEQSKKIEESKAVSTDIEIPKPEGLEFLPFQKAGIAYASDRENVLIGDEMGLGKTIQAVGVCNLKQYKSVLIVCPASLKINWLREWQKWDTNKRSISIANGKIEKTDVVIINYDIVRKHHAEILAREWDCMIVDECHYLKNPKALRTKHVLGGKGIEAIKSGQKIFLTGTPILNRPIELWPILHAIDAKGLGRNWRNYVVDFCNGKQTRFGWDVSGASKLDELQEKLRVACMVRRLKKDVLAELPAKRRQVVELPANGSLSQIKKENTLWTEHKKTIEALRVAKEKAEAETEAYRESMQNLSAAAKISFAEISRIRHETALVKIPALIQYITDALENEEKIIVFAHHHDVIDSISDAFPEISVKLTGETSSADRQTAVDKFQNDEKVKLFIGSIQAAGVGITLTRSSFVIFAELDWSPGNMSQAEDRAHRIGQTQSVLIQHIVLEGSIDADIARTLLRKQEIIETALDSETGKSVECAKE